MNTGSMTKAELVEEVSRVSDLTKKHSEVIVDTVFKSIIDALHRGEKIELRGFGSFRLREHADERVTGLVVGDGLRSPRTARCRAGRRARSLQRVGEVGELDLIVIAPRRRQRGLVGEVREIGADMPGVVAATVRGRRRRRAAACACGPRGSCGGRPCRAADGDAAVEAAGPQQRGVEDLGTVGGAEHDDRDVGSKPSISVRIWLSVCSRSSLPPPKPTPGGASARSRRARR